MAMTWWRQPAEQARPHVRPAALLAALLLGVSVLVPALVGGRHAAAADTDLGALKEAFKRPTKIPFPADNPYTDIKAKLGEMLFFDPRLSGDKNISCATCHIAGLAWADAIKLSIGAGNRMMNKRSQTLLNLAWSELLMWDGRFPNLEEQILGPLFKNDIMNNNRTAMIDEVTAIPAYRRLFEQAFPKEDITVESIAKAIATYERTIVSNKAPFDRWVDGDDKAMTDSAKRGFALFNGKANCVACHNSWRFTDDGFHDIGLDDDDPGRGRHVPDVPVLEHAFKTPTLRNVAQRPPYMHNGEVATLEEVIKHYVGGFKERESLSPEMKKFSATPEEIQDLVAFMHALTSEDDPVQIPLLPVKEAM